MRQWIVGGTLLALVAAGCADATAEPDVSAAAVEGEAAAVDAPTTAAPTTTVAPTTTTTTTPPTTTAAPTTPAPRAASGGNRAGGGAARIASDGTPTFPGDFADPDLVLHDDVFYAYATNTLFMNVPVLSTAAPNTIVGDALPELPAWSEPHHVWAPSVTQVGDHWVLHYTTRHSASGRQCISVAVGDNPAGPFVDDSTEPLICALDQGGAIDPSVVFDGDDPYLLWKTDGNCCGLPTIIYSQPLSADGTELAGDPIELIRNDLWWERDVVEGPSMIEVDGDWWLFYSANRWDTPDYAVGLAECDSVTGPCEKRSDPWLSSTDTTAGPGGLEVVELPARAADVVVYHGWTGDEVGYPDGVRALYVRPIRWTADGPVLVGG